MEKRIPLKKRIWLSIKRPFAEIGSLISKNKSRTLLFSIIILYGILMFKFSFAPLMRNVNSVAALRDNKTLADAKQIVLFIKNFQEAALPKPDIYSELTLHLDSLDMMIGQNPEIQQSLLEINKLNKNISNAFKEIEMTKISLINLIEKLNIAKKMANTIYNKMMDMIVVGLTFLFFYIVGFMGYAMDDSKEDYI